METPLFNLPLIPEGSDTPEVLHNVAINQATALMHLAIKDRDLTAPPGTQVNGDVFLPKATASGDWAGQENRLAIWFDGWLRNEAGNFPSLKEGVILRILDENLTLQYDGAALVAFNAGTLGKFDATTAPTVNEDSGDGYSVGSLWVDVTNDVAYICVDATVAAAKWAQIHRKHLLGFKPWDNEPPASAFAVLDSRNSRPVLSFAATNDAAVFSGTLPDSYRGGSLVVRVHWMAETATSGNVEWDATFEQQNAGEDLDSDFWATAQAGGAVATPGTSGRAPTTSITCAAGATGTDSLVAGDRFRLRVRRTSNTSIAGNSQILAVDVLEVL